MPYRIRFKIEVNGEWRVRELEFEFYETLFDFLLALLGGMKEGRVAMIHIEVIE